MDREVEKGDKSKGQNPRKKYHNKKGNQAFSLLMSRDETGSKNNPVRSRGGTNAPADERVGKGPHRAGNAAYWASVAGPTRDRGKGSKAKRRAAAIGEENVQELFITRLSPEEKRKKKVETLIRLMKHAKDPAADVAKTKKEDYDIQEKSLSRVISKTQKGGIAIMSSDRGDKTTKEKNERSKNLVSRIRGAGLPGPTKVTGAYHEKDHGEQKEKSFVVSSGKMGKRKFKKTVSKLGQEGGLKHTRNQKPGSKKDDQDSVLIKQKPGSQSKASWLGTSRRSDADPKLGKKYDQGKLSTKDANSPLKPGEGATIVGKKKMQFK